MTSSGAIAPSLLLAVISLLVYQPLAGQTPDSTLLRSAQDALLSTLDSTASGLTLAEWLARLGGDPVTAVRWELNDCGEGGDGRAAPTCVEGHVTLAPDTSVTVDVIVVGLDGTPAPHPELFSLTAARGADVTFVNTFREMEELVGRRSP